MAPTTGFVGQIHELDGVTPARAPSFFEKGVLRICLLVVQISTAVFRAYSWWVGGFPNQRVYTNLANAARRPDELRLFLHQEAKKETVTGFFMREFLALPELHGHLFEIMKGAHVCLQDQGRLFDIWCNHPEVQQRISSHPGLSLELDHCLFGTIDRLGIRHTCFQFERTPLSRGWVSKALHLIDYLHYKITGEQQGPAGNSPIVDRKGLVFAIDMDNYYFKRQQLSDFSLDLADEGVLA